MRFFPTLAHRFPSYVVSALIAADAVLLFRSVLFASRAAVCSCAVLLAVGGFLGDAKAFNQRWPSSSSSLIVFSQHPRSSA